MSTAFVYIVCSVLILLVIREIQPSIAMLGGIFITLATVGAAVGKFTAFTDFFRGLVRGEYGDDMLLMLQVTGVSVCADVGADICTQAGYASAGKGLLLYGRVCILLMALPLVKELTDGVRVFFS